MPSRIAFGSCNHQDRKNKLWPLIEARDPVAFVWGGDAIYADYHSSRDWKSWPPTLSTPLHCATPQRLNSLYQRQRTNPDYQRLLTSNVTVFGTFDDHDYGCNNADSTFEFHHESALEYVEFLGLAQESAMYKRAQAGEGVYGVKLFDFSRSRDDVEVPEEEASIDPDVLSAKVLPHSPYSHSNKTVTVFVLDVRTHKTPWKPGTEGYELDYEGDFLGERQWQWFETAIRRSRASVNVVVNGLQVHANRFPNGNIAEAWGRFPRAQQRLFDTVLQDGVEAPILISGDVHMTQLMRKDCIRKGEPYTEARPLVEMTTSGMTHSWGTISSPRPSSRPRKRPSWRGLYKSYLKATLMTTLHTICPWTDLMAADPTDAINGRWENGGGEGARSGLQYSLAKNFGELEFDWELRTVKMRTFGENKEAAPLLMAEISFDQLSGRKTVTGGRLSDLDFQEATSIRNDTLPESEWICVNHRGAENQALHMLGHAATGVVMLLLVPAPFFLPIFFLVLFYRTRCRRRVSNPSRMHTSSTCRF